MKLVMDPLDPCQGAILVIPKLTTCFDKRGYVVTSNPYVFLVLFTGLDGVKRGDRKRHIRRRMQFFSLFNLCTALAQILRNENIPEEWTRKRD